MAAGMVGSALLLRPLLVFSIGAGGFLLVPSWFAWAGLLFWRSAVLPSQLNVVQIHDEHLIFDLPESPTDGL